MAVKFEESVSIKSEAGAPVALVVDNLAVAGAIFQAKDNTTTKVAINNGGLTEISLLQADMPTDGSKGALTVSTTLPASPSAAVYGTKQSVTTAGSAAYQQVGGGVDLLAGYTGGSPTVGFYAINGVAGTSASLATSAAAPYASGNMGLYGLVGAGTVNVGIGGVANGGSTVSIGALGRTTVSNTRSIGVNGTVNGGSTAQAGGLFDLSHGATAVALAQSAALIADNAAVAAPIFLARDNGTTVFSVEDGGPTKWTQATGGSTMTVGSNQEALTLSVGGAATNTAGNLAPALSRIKAITYRVTTTITTAASYTVTITGGAAWKDMALASTTITNLTAGQTGVLVPGTFGDDLVAAATTLTVTCNTTPGAGAIRLTVWYETFAAPTS